MSKKHPFGPRRFSSPVSWLWWLAIVIALVGGGIAYALSFDHANPASRGWMALVLMVTVVGSGICMICASAGWFLKR